MRALKFLGVVIAQAIVGAVAGAVIWFILVATWPHFEPQTFLIGGAVLAALIGIARMDEWA